MFQLAPRAARRLAVLGAFVAASWLAAWLVASRHALLDDALIHLRYAHKLRDHGFFTFDGVNESYGTSSPLFVSLLAWASFLFRGPLLSKAISVLAYLGLLGTFAWQAMRGAPAALRSVWLLLLISCISPSGVRWLSDGMETSLHLLLLVGAVLALTGRPGANRAQVMSCFVLALAIESTRIESIVGLGVIGVAGFLTFHDDRRRYAAVVLPVAATLVLLFLRVEFGSWLPDTALAKQAGAIPLPTALYQCLRTTGAALTLGVGVCTAWLQSLWYSLRRSKFSPVVLANAAIPIATLLGISVRGQVLQGVRYLLWIPVAMCVLNLRTVANDPGGLPASNRWHRWLLPAAAVLGVVIEAPLGWPVLQARSRLFDQMQADHLEQLQGATGAAADLGFIAYFSRARLLDYSGLVNGRALAAMEPTARARLIAAQRPDFLYLDHDQAVSVRQSLDLDRDYLTCRTYATQTLTHIQIYELRLRLPEAQRHLRLCRPGTSSVGSGDPRPG